MLSHQQFVSYISRLAASSGKKSALLASPDKSYVGDFIIGEEGEHADEYPAANLLQIKNILKENMSLYLSYPPSELELGMIWRTQKIDKVFSSDLENTNSFKFYTVQRDGAELHDITIDPNSIEYNTLTKNLESYAYYIKSIEQQESRLNDAKAKSISTRELPDSVVSTLRQGLANRHSLVDSRAEAKINEDFMRIVYELVNRGWNEADPKKVCGERVHGNNIGGIIVNKDNKIIAWGLNYKSVNQTFHAETIMIQNYLRKHNSDKLPDGCKVYTSLQCCFMCAGHIATLGKDIQVFYGQKDPFFSGKTAFGKGINGCSEAQSTLPYVDVLAQAVGEQNILSFLFGVHPEDANKTMPIKDLFARGLRDISLFDELRNAVRKRNIDKTLTSSFSEQSCIIQEGKAFLAELDQHVFHPAPTLSVAPQRTEKSIIRQMLFHHQAKTSKSAANDQGVACMPMDKEVMGKDKIAISDPTKGRNKK